MLNNNKHWSIFLILNNIFLLVNSLSNIMFTEAINKSDPAVLKQQDDFPKEELKGTQPPNGWENKEVVFQ